MKLRFSALPALWLVLTTSNPTAAQTADDAVKQLFGSTHPHLEFVDLEYKLYPGSTGEGRIVVEGYTSPTDTLYVPDGSIYKKAIDSILPKPYEKAIVQKLLQSTPDFKSLQYFRKHRDKGKKEKFLLEASYSELVSSFRFRPTNFEGDLQGTAGAQLPENAIIDGEPSHDKFLERVKLKRKEVSGAVAAKSDEMFMFFRGATLTAVKQAPPPPSLQNLAVNQLPVPYITASLQFEDPTFAGIDAAIVRLAGNVQITPRFSELPPNRQDGKSLWPTILDYGGSKVAEPSPTLPYIGECRYYTNGPQCFVIIDHPLRVTRDKLGRNKPITIDSPDEDLTDAARSIFALGKLIFVKTEQGPMFADEDNDPRHAWFIVKE